MRLFPMQRSVDGRAAHPDQHLAAGSTAYPALRQKNNHLPLRGGTRFHIRHRAPGASDRACHAESTHTAPPPPRYLAADTAVFSSVQQLVVWPPLEACVA